MKLNNKGFAISGILYSLLILFVTLFLGMLTIFASSKFSFDKIKKELINKLSFQEPNHNMISNDSCIGNIGVLCNTGTEVTVQVNEVENYNFYVIKDTGEKVTLLMNKNLDGNVAWISKSDYISAGGVEIDYGINGNNNIGPMTALSYLETQTALWTNIPEMSYVLTDDGDKYSDMTRSNVRARMLTKQEVESLCSNSNCPSYLYSNLSFANTTADPYGYWLSSSFSDTGMAWNIYYNGILNEHINIDNTIGVRPVIVMFKMK